MNEIRWIKASIAKHFYTTLGTFKLYIEGQERKIEDQHFIELKLDGPDIAYFPSNIRRFRVHVNALVQTTITSDAYIHERNIGIAMPCFSECITVKQYNESPNTTVGILIRRSDVDVSNFGRVSQETNLMQASLEAVYEMEI